jgi:hypothetical protein
VVETRIGFMMSLRLGHVNDVIISIYGLVPDYTESDPDTATVTSPTSSGKLGFGIAGHLFEISRLNHNDSAHVTLVFSSPHRLKASKLNIVS